MTVHGWAEAALAVPLALAAWAVWRYRVDRLYLMEVIRRPRSQRSRAVSSLSAAFLLVAALAALVGGLVSAL